MKELSTWLSPKDAAMPLNEGGYAIAIPTQAKMRSEGKIPFKKIGGKTIRYSRVELDAWIDDHTVVSNFKKALVNTDTIQNIKGE